MDVKLLSTRIDMLLDAIDDASDGEEAWLEHGPYRRILEAARDLRETAQEEIGGLKTSYEPNQLR
jgi:hypothetical protein